MEFNKSSTAYDSSKIIFHPSTVYYHIITNVGFLLPFCGCGFFVFCSAHTRPTGPLELEQQICLQVGTCAQVHAVSGRPSSSLAGSVFSLDQEGLKWPGMLCGPSVSQFPLQPGVPTLISTPGDSPSPWKVSGPAIRSHCLFFVVPSFVSITST